MAGAQKLPKLTILYVHGWKHDASRNDSDLKNFGRMIDNLRVQHEMRKQVIGIFVGWNATSGLPGSISLPKVDGLSTASASLLGIVLSRGHRDHWGLVPKVSPTIPLIMGKATESIIRAAADFVPDAVALHASHYLEHRKASERRTGPYGSPALDCRDSSNQKV